MADNNDQIISSINNVKSAINTVAANQVKINDSIKEVTSSANSKNADTNITSVIENLEESITESLQDIGDGLKLTLKEKNDKEEQGIKEQLDGLRVFIPECGEIADLLIAINSKLSSTETDTEDDIKKLKEDTAEDEDRSFDTSADTVSSLSGLTNLVSITGTGFSILGNILTGMRDLFASVLEGIGPGQLQQFLVTSELQTTTQEIQKAEPEQASQGKLAAFFQGIAGPLESIAASTLMLSIAIGILTTVGLDAKAIATVMLLNTFMLTMFTVFAAISAKISENSTLLNPENSSITLAIKQFAAILTIVGITMLASAALVQILKPIWLDTLIGVSVLFGTTFLTIFALAGLAYLAKNLIGEENNPLTALINDFVKIVLTVSGVAILCALLWDTIQVGLGYAIQILLLSAGVVVTLAVISAAISKSGITTEQIKAFQSLLATSILLIGVVSVLAIILGLLPTDIIMQGVIAVGVIVGLVIGLLAMLKAGIKAISDVEPAQVQALINLLITTTVMIGLLGLLVIVLSFIDQESLIRSVAAVFLISTIPLILTYALANLGKKQELIAQAGLGIIAALAVTVAIVALTWLIINSLGGFTQEQVINSMLAVTWTTGLVIVVGVAIVLLGAAAPATAAAMVPALLTIGVATIVVAALTGITILLARSLSAEQSQQAIQAAIALTIVTSSLVIVSAAIVALGALAIPLMVSSTLALIAVGVLNSFLGIFTTQLALITETISKLTLPENFNEGINSVRNTTLGFVQINRSLLAFNVIAYLLVAQLIAGGAALLAMNVALLIFVPAYSAALLMFRSLPSSSLNLTYLRQAISQLNAFSNSVNSFIAPSLGKMLAVDTTLAFIGRLTKRIKQIGDEETISRVNNLATNLAQLAQNASGLTNLAQSINEVASATEKLNETNSRTTIADLSGTNETELNLNLKEQKLEIPDNTEVLTNILEALKELIAETKETKQAMQNLASVTDNISRFNDQPKQSFIEE